MSFDARNLQMYAISSDLCHSTDFTVSRRQESSDLYHSTGFTVIRRQESSDLCHSTGFTYGFVPLHRLQRNSTPEIFGFMPLHRLHLACGGEPLSTFRSQGLLSPKYKPTRNHYKHTDPPSKLWWFAWPSTHYRYHTPITARDSHAMRRLKKKLPYEPSIDSHFIWFTIQYITVPLPRHRRQRVHHMMHFLQSRYFWNDYSLDLDANPRKMAWRHNVMNDNARKVIK